MRSLLNDSYTPIEIDYFKVNLLPMKIAIEFSMFKLFDYILQSYNKSESEFFSLSEIKTLRNI